MSPIDSGRGNHALELIAHLRTDRTVDRRVRSIGFALHYRRSRVRCGANRHVQRYLAEKRYREPFRFMPRSTVTENIRSGTAMRTLEIAHVLDNAENRHVDLLEPGEP